MSDVSVTAANVAKAIAQLGLEGSSTEDGTYGATVTAGQPLYRDSTADYKLKLAQATTATLAAVYGIALNGGGNNQPATILRRGLYNPGFTVTVGQTYVVSAAAAGGIAPISDLASTNYVSIIGVGITASLLFVNFIVAGVAKP